MLSPPFLSLCLQMVTAAIMKNPKFVKMIAMTGAMKAQMKLELGFKKQL